MLGRQVRVFFRITGGWVLTWLLAGAAAACALVFIELLISLQIANLLQMLGLVTEKLPMPLGLGTLTDSRAVFMVLFVLLGFFRGGCYFVISHSANFAHEAILNRLRLLAYHEAFGSDRPMVSLATLTTRISDIFPRATLWCLYFANFVPALIQTLFLAALLFMKSASLTGIAIGTIGVVGLFVHFVNGYVRKVVATIPALGESMIQRMMRMSRNRFLLKALRMMESEHLQLRLSSLRFATQIIRSNAMGNFSAVLPQVLGMATVMILIYVELKTGGLSGMTFLAFLYLFLRMVQSLATASGQYGSMNAQSAAFRLVSDYVTGFSDEEFDRAVMPSRNLSAIGLRRKVEAYSAFHDRPIADSSNGSTTAPTLSFRGVSFRYQAEDGEVLKNFDLEIRSGETCAIMGQSGSGKSTLLALLLGLLEAERGKIEIAGKSPRAYFSDPNLRLGFVGAEPYLIEGTVRENLLYGTRGTHHTDQDFRSVLERAQLGELLQANPDFLNHRMSENGEGLSTGQKQRLMFARALLVKPTLLLLDEASANLDEKTEAMMAAEIEKLQGSCTIVIITHRSNFVKWVGNRIQITKEKSVGGVPFEHQP